jgi:hypothetical protein
MYGTASSMLARARAVTRHTYRERQLGKRCRRARRAPSQASGSARGKLQALLVPVLCTSPQPPHATVRRLAELTRVCAPRARARERGLAAFSKRAQRHRLWVIRLACGAIALELRVRGGQVDDRGRGARVKGANVSIEYTCGEFVSRTMVALANALVLPDKEAGLRAQRVGGSGWEEEKRE